MLPKWQNYAFGSVIGLNRLLMVANIIEPQLGSNGLNETILNRQVIFLFFSFFFRRNVWINRFYHFTFFYCLLSETSHVQSEAFVLVDRRIGQHERNNGSNEVRLK
jgi:hypothetical protein